jgi:insertion element IS1 protein InsB
MVKNGISLSRGVADQWEAYQGVMPSNKHRIIEKRKRETNHIERFNNTLRQRISRLGRKTPFFKEIFAPYRFSCSFYSTL